MDDPDLWFLERQPVRRARQAWAVWILAAAAWLLLGLAGRMGLPMVAAWTLWAIIGVALPAAALIAEMETRGLGRTLRVRLRPLRWSAEIPLDDVDDARADRYAPIREFGGWGWRRTPWGGRCYSISGDRGVRLQTGGGRIVIGSRRPEELAAAINEAKSARSV